MFVPLHTKSDHSLGYGTASVEELLQAASRQSFPALALTDVENVYAQVRFHHAARHFGIRPITGVELRPGHGRGGIGGHARRLVLLARDAAGWRSLCRILTRRRASAAPTPDPLSCLEDEPNGLFFLSDDPVAVEALLRAGVDSDDVRFLLVRPGGAAPPRGVRCIADPDVVMVDPGDRPLHALLMAARRRMRLDHVTDREPPERCLPEAAAIRRRWADVPEAVLETLRIAEACTLDLTGRIALDTVLGFVHPSASEELARRARERFESARRAGRFRTEAHRARLERELEVLGARGLAPLVLAVTEIADHARPEGLRLLLRGSAVGSLALHVLGVSAIDPITHGLLFERFVHRDPADVPDIDLDVPFEARDALADWVARRFGRARVAGIVALQTYRRRGAYRAGLAALGMRPTDVDRFCAGIPDESVVEASASPPLPQVPFVARDLVPWIERMIGKPHHVSVHAGGLVLAGPTVQDHSPLERAPKGVLVTQLDMHALERRGLPKLDLLGNRALSAVVAAQRAIGSDLHVARDDAATRALLERGDTVGCAQIETPVMRSALRRLPVRNADDLIAALAIVRPGPAAGEAKAAFARRAAAEEPAQAPHPRLASTLASTYGLVLYEEDLMSSLALMTGWTLERADAVRSAIVRADDDRGPLAELERDFVTAARATGVRDADARTVWATLARLAAYTFSRAHAASYAMLAWETAAVKAHAPAALAAAVLDRYGGHYPLRTVAADFVRHGVELRLPHVHCSAPETRIEAGAVRIGLGRIRRLTGRSGYALIERRPFHDLSDLLARVPLSRPEREALVLSGACDGLEPLDPAAYPFTHEEALRRLREQPVDRALAGFVARRAAGPRADTYRALVRVRNELHTLDMHVTAHPMAVLRAEASRVGCIATTELPAHVGERVSLAGIVAASRRVATRGGSLVQFVTLEDERGLAEAVVMPGAPATLGHPVTNPGPFLIEGRVVGPAHDPHLEIRRVLPFHLRSRASATRWG